VYKTIEKSEQALFKSDDASLTYEVDPLDNKRKHVVFSLSTCKKLNLGNLSPIFVNTLEDQILASVEIIENKLNKDLESLGVCICIFHLHGYQSIPL
jgi:hypothetical protein